MTTTKQFVEEHLNIVKRVDKVYAESLQWMKDYFDKMTTKDLEDLKVNQKFLRDNGMMRNEVTVEELVLPVEME